MYVFISYVAQLLEFEERILSDVIDAAMVENGLRKFTR